MTPAEDLHEQAQLLRDEVREVRDFLENWRAGRQEVQV